MAVILQDVVAPSDPVAEATCRLISNLASLRQHEGADHARIEAMAMHNAAIAVLRPDIGTDGVGRMLDLAAEANARIAARDRESVETGRRRKAVAARRGRRP